MNVSRLLNKGPGIVDTWTDEQSTINEEMWGAWIEKRKFRERVAARKRHALIRISLAILAFGTVICLIAVKW